MNQKVVKKEDLFEGSVLNYLNNLYDNLDLININISRKDFISRLQDKYTNEEIKQIRKKRFAEIAYIFEDIAIEAKYGKKPDEDPSFFKKIKQNYSFNRCYNLF